MCGSIFGVGDEVIVGEVVPCIVVVVIVIVIVSFICSEKMISNAALDASCDQPLLPYKQIHTPRIYLK